MILEIITAVFLILSICLNVFLVKKLLYFSENVEGILFSLNEFREHLEEVNGYELYYGDETLAKLLEHSKAVVGDIEIVQNNYGGDSNDESTT